jgi:hypothetical protein
MRPTKGDKVRLTDNFIQNHGNSIPWVSSLRGLELDVTNIKLITMSPIKIIDIYFISNGMAYALRVDDSGKFVDKSNSPTSDFVFERVNTVVTIPAQPNPTPSSLPPWITNSKTVKKSIPATGGKPQFDYADVNCKCPQCGSPAIRLLSKVICSSSSCINADRP